MASRILSQSVRLALRSSLLRAPRFAVPARSFSVTPLRSNATSQLLHKVVTDELKYEEADSFGLDESFKNYLDEQKIEIVNTDGSVLAELVKTTPEEKVHIYFDVLKISNVSYQLKQMQEEADQEYLAEDIAEHGFADVNVVIEKNGKAIGYDLNLSLIDSQFFVGGITYFDDATLALSESPEAEAKRDVKYSGPLFSNLAEELQEAINEHLAARGIDSQLAEFILAYATVKENNEYLDWLSQLKDFTA
ncbi:Mam33 protein [Martiniozyma asiatica (nom. inval.)]|nr:Mam33 protein [Martiniozyma asiatica]